MKTILLTFLSAAFLLYVTTGCVDDYIIRGNGIPIDEARQTPAFYSVSSKGNFDVHITYGEVHEVIIHAESNLLPYIETDVRDNNLKLQVRGFHNLRNRLPIEVFIAVPYIRNVVQSGSGDISTGHFEGDEFTFVLSGSGSIESSVDAGLVDAIVSGSGSLILSGEASSADFVVSGSGEIDAWNLTLVDCEAMISGSGDIWTMVSHYLKAAISGSGNIYYLGTPQIESQVSGSGRVIRKN